MLRPSIWQLHGWDYNRTVWFLGRRQGQKMFTATLFIKVKSRLCLSLALRSLPHEVPTCGPYRYSGTRNGLAEHAVAMGANPSKGRNANPHALPQLYLRAVTWASVSVWEDGLGICNNLPVEDMAGLREGGQVKNLETFVPP